MGYNLAGHSNLGLEIHHTLPSLLLKFLLKNLLLYSDGFAFICDLVLLAAFSIISLLCKLNVLSIISSGEVLFWSCLFSVLKAFYT
jgi:hypothetical protein